MIEFNYTTKRGRDVWVRCAKTDQEKKELQQHVDQLRTIGSLVPPGGETGMWVTATLEVERYFVAVTSLKFKVRFLSGEESAIRAEVQKKLAIHN